MLGEDRTLRLLLSAERVLWRLGYEAVGRRYGEAFHNAAIAFSLDWLPEGARVLDVGCGPGRVARVIAERAGTVVGIDYEPTWIAAANAIPYPANVSFEVGDARELPDASFDVALLVHVLEHLDDPVDVLRELTRVAPTLIVEVPSFDRDALNWARLRLGLDFSSDDDHVREYTEELLAAQLADAGWHVTASGHSAMSIATIATQAG